MLRYLGPWLLPGAFRVAAAAPQAKPIPGVGPAFLRQGGDPLIRETPLSAPAALDKSLPAGAAEGTRLLPGWDAPGFRAGRLPEGGHEARLQTRRRGETGGEGLPALTASRRLR